MEDIVAQRVITQLVDDVDGTELTEGDGETINIALDGASYVLDLSSKNASRLRKDFGKWLDHARKAPGSTRGRRSGGGTTRRDPEQTKKIRQWAQDNGHQVSERGRIPATVVEAYEAAH